MVRYGFGLPELRQLYIDEFHSFFSELVVNLEREGVLKEGTSERMKARSEVEKLRLALRGIKKL